MKKFNWAVIGLGNIASTTMRALASLENASLYACASRSLEKAIEFQKKLDFQKAYGSYSEVFADPNVDVVYISTPHNFHADLTKQAILNGKAVVCEKPSTVNKSQFLEIMSASENAKVFFMEAMWTKFLPAWRFVLDSIKGGKLGKIQAFYADFCMDVPYTPGSRLYEPSLAGGALLDVGIYPLSASIMVASAAQNCDFSKTYIKNVQSSCIKTQTGVDAVDSIIIDFGDFCGVLTASVNSGCGNHFESAKIVGEKGVLHIPQFWHADKVNFLAKDGTLIQQFDFPFNVNGYEFEFESAMAEMENGNVESAIHSKEDTLLLISIMDDLRKSWNLVYPFENPVDLTTSDDCNNSGDLGENGDCKNPGDLGESGDCKNPVDLATSDDCKNPAALEKPANQIIVYTDGACSGNPGPGGFGAVVLCGDQEIPLSGGEKHTTNNRMELMAAIEALEYINDSPELKKLPILLITDSQYVKNGINSWIYAWKKKNWQTSTKEPVKNQDLWMELDELCASLTVKWDWVKGHAGDKYNEICDKLAVEASKNQ